MRVTIFPFLIAVILLSSNFSRSQTLFTKHITEYDTTINTIHIFVALCDNQYQGIIPVPKAIGNGQDPDNNLYWGCGYGVRTFFKRSAEWKLIKTIKGKAVVLERLVFKHTTKNYYLVADAYDGQFIKKCTIDFLKSVSGQLKDTLHVDDKIIGINGNSKMVTYTGHDGLMDFTLDQEFKNKDGKSRDVIILACSSQEFFSPYLKQAKANPMVLTKGLMCPEAYTTHDALSSYVSDKGKAAVRESAAQAYNKYQKCGIKAARWLLVSGYE